MRIQRAEPPKAVTVVPARGGARPGAGRPPRVRNGRIRSICRRLAAHGITQEESAQILGIGETTLKARLGDEFKAGIEDYDGAVVRNLRRHALGEGPGAVTAAIYWTKTRLGWSEKIRLEHTFGPIVERMVSSLLDLLHRVIPDFCPGCRTALNLKPEIAKLLIEESEKLTGAAAAVASEIPHLREGGA